MGYTTENGCLTWRTAESDLAGERRWKWYEANAALIDSLIAGTHVVVPKEPTEAMVEAGNQSEHTIELMEGHPTPREQIAAIYRSMISTAPKG